MYKCLVVTDPETAPGFRMAGVEVIELAHPDEAEKLVIRLLHRDDTGVIAMNEDFIVKLDHKIMERIERSYRPIIIPIPSGRKQVDRESYMDRLLRRAIGYNIVVRR
ncbi:MAG: V-type ATP synthase subunit F [Methanocalculus sp.]|uniref:V-type ATP synthase subunit F n=1 Tax=Methanocalculus sp. TaxID=2004547 RepID=UPI0027219049|nr:V-type ATP synthase subunit F [Methanocalculus sp.]MDO9539003.1 V-type ATP synthase subunit F [Methanocalculus sp.]